MTWAFLDDHGHENDKLLEIGGAAAWYWACGLMYCRRKQEERARKGMPFNFIPSVAASSLYADKRSADHIKAIVAAGLWVETKGGFLVHDYKAVYGTDGTCAPPVSPSTAPASEPAEQPKKPSQLGGKVRSAGASRGPAGRFQPLSAGPADDQLAGDSRGPAGPAETQPAGADHQPAGPAGVQPTTSQLVQPAPAGVQLAPAPRAPGSGSGSDPKEEDGSSKDLTGSRAREAPAGPAAEPAGTSRPSNPHENWDGAEHESICPLDLTEKAERVGVPREMAAALKVDELQILDAIREFVGYWTIGGGMGKKHRFWMRKLREHVRKAKEQHRLKPLAAIKDQQPPADDTGGYGKASDWG